MRSGSGNAKTDIDEVSLVLGDHRYATPHYDKALRDQVLGRWSRDLIGVSRYYLLAKPPIVVDFEPAPVEGKFYVDEKRRFFQERGIVYVPIFLRESLTQAEFRERVQQAREAAKQAVKLSGEDRPRAYPCGSGDAIPGQFRRGRQRPTPLAAAPTP